MTIYEVENGNVNIVIKLNYEKDFIEKKYGTLENFVKYLFSVRDLVDSEGNVTGQTKPRFLYNPKWVCSYTDIKDPIIKDGKIIERPAEVVING